MPTLTQKYTIIQLLEELQVGAKFSSGSWPLHTSVVDTFAIDWDIPTIINKLTRSLAHHARASSIAMDDAFFGAEQQTQVVLLQKTDSLIKLHYDVIELLQQGGLKLNDPQYAREGFIPHATVQEHARLNKGDTVTYCALTLIDMFPDRDPHQRKVLGTIQLENQG